MNRSSLIAILVACAAPLAGAQTLPPVRPIGPAIARSTELLGSVSTTRQLPGGRVLVNDILKRRLLMFDSTFTTVTVVADSTSNTANAYGGRVGGLIPFRGDSSLFVDPQSLSMLVIDPNGKIARVMSAPRSQDAISLIGTNGLPGFDAKGRLVYRGNPRIGFTTQNGAVMSTPDFPDSAAIVRVDLDTRKLDTAAFLKIPKQKVSVTQTSNGGFSISALVNPLPITDDWAILTDGTIAIVRGSDYHIDWLGSDGTRSSSPKIPYEWQRLDDDAKAALLDSARVAMEKQREMAMQNMASGRGAGGPVMFGGGDAGGMRMTVERGAAERGAQPPVSGRGAEPGAPAAPKPGETPKDSAAQKAGAAGKEGSAPAPAGLTMPQINLVSASELPDYRPAFNIGSSRGDLDGNLWIRTTSPVGNDGPVYFVINRKGEVVDRVQVPQGRLVSGFGEGGIVYLAVRDAAGNVRLERARLK